MLWNVGLECECHGYGLWRLRDESEGVVRDPGFGGVVGPPGSLRPRGSLEPPSSEGKGGGGGGGLDRPFGFTWSREADFRNAFCGPEKVSSGGMLEDEIKV